MELVYLWVEDYKNIKRQGFKFSSYLDFEFSYIIKKQKKIYQLDIKEKQKDISDFFGKNIDITAIVGKNGSGKSSLLDILEDNFKMRDNGYFIIFKREDMYYCQFNYIKPAINFEHDIEYLDNSSHSNENFFYPKEIRIAYEKKIGEKDLSHYYFGEYSGIFGGMNVNRRNDYNILEARFFVPRYINIITKHLELFDNFKEMYKFNTLRLLLKSSSASHIRQWIDKEKTNFVIRRTLGSKEVCVYEKSEQILNHIQKELRCPLEEIKIHLYDRNREKIVSVLENIEKIHRQQTSENQIKKFNKYQEFDLAILIAFVEYYLKTTEPCENSEVLYKILLEVEEEIKSNVLIHDYTLRIVKSYIMSFFRKLQEKKFKFSNKDLLSIEQMIKTIKYIEQFEINYFDKNGNPYLDITINEALKENLHHIKFLQKIFFDYEFDCGNERHLRVFEYDLIDKELGSSYETISDGEKHFIRFGIDIIYYLQTIKEYNSTPDKESLALFIADEPDNAMHPIWKRKLIYSALKIFNSFSDTPNIKKHLIFATHSPFLLSDIPKENIICLDRIDSDTKEKYPSLNLSGLENGMCLNVSKYIELNSFGANIHNLLTHGFFMEDGLMGEFSKNKINDVIKFLNSDSSTMIKNKEEAKSIIEIIGEPFLNDKLMKMYNGKFKTNEEKIQELEAKIERLRNA